jgi:peptide/nickel transport system ATP-binding protein
VNDVLNITDLSRTFQIKRGLFGKSGELRAVAEVDVKLERNEVLGIVGESGSGKSTLAKMILGLITPSSGSIKILGQDLTKQDPHVRAQQIQPVFQDPYSSLNPRKTIKQIVTLPLAVQGNVSASERHEKAVELIRQVGLTERHLGVFPNEVSGGQRQRVAIARALILRPEIVLLDEPTSALDVSVQSQILNLLNDLRREMNLTYVFISHNLAVVEYIATRVAVMYLGRIVELGTREDIFDNPQHPYTQALLDSILTLDTSAGVPTTGLGLAVPDPINPPPGCVFHPRCPKAGPRCKVEQPKAVNRTEGDADRFTRCHLYDGGTA